MEKFEYMAVKIEFNIWKGKVKEDYLEILNEYGAKGWRFVQIAPQTFKPTAGQ